MVIARVEALIAGFPMKDALERRLLYAEAGADAILIHSKAETADEVLEFAIAWDRLVDRDVPLAVVPTTYTDVLAAIERDGTSSAIEPVLSPVGEMFDLVGMEKLDREERELCAEANAVRHAASTADRPPELLAGNSDRRS
jgi:Phosphoenolpyruvate phosphomutase